MPRRINGAASGAVAFAFAFAFAEDVVYAEVGRRQAAGSG
ncbi:hypothetical protein LX83_004655 [Goodfellowiella coeruleoviolacea]|uniref:Uncharacterized protein n=1 Tax=Goodfellowiella coeruleoviolacea TaxID=334858 RepID=A0AAE3KIA9_9PSEU|nr:hypothetical protein [Goodfellowiella coeruleoviolacea]